MAEQREQTRARIFAQDICRELYDRFAMGGWEPIDAHNWVIAQLQEFASQAPRQSEQWMKEAAQEIVKGGWKVPENIAAIIASRAPKEPTAQDFCADMIANLIHNVKHAPKEPTAPTEEKK